MINSCFLSLTNTLILYIFVRGLKRSYKWGEGGGGLYLRGLTTGKVKALQNKL